MNKVDERCGKNKHAKFHYASNRIFTELKVIKVLLYILAIVPVVLSFIPQVKSTHSLICSIISFALSIVTECVTSFLTKHKDAGIHSLQLYETGVTGSPFSKIEYDREMTNDLNELAIRKGLAKAQNVEEKYKISVPDDIIDDYSYLYICRISAATNKYLLSRIFYIYFFFLMGIVALFVGMIFLKTETTEYLALIIAFYPLVSPIIKDCNSAKECMRNCTKTCADIDNFFADGDVSTERLARMHYYVQQLEYEMYRNRPVVFNFFKRMFRKGVEVLQTGVTDRFRAAIVELKQKALIQRGVIAQPRGKSLIVQQEIDLETLTKLERKKKLQKAQKQLAVTDAGGKVAKPVQKPAQQSAKKPVASTSKTPKVKTAKKTAKSNTKKK
ncbi:MAG: hypothetical protein K2O89_01625 [Clostridia bacterium]|nr:hypothetical protein [Clostridia bacterium]